MYKLKIFLILFIVIMSSTTALAANCNKMWVRSVSATEFGTGAATWLINQSGSVCGTVPD